MSGNHPCSAMKVLAVLSLLALCLLQGPLPALGTCGCEEIGRTVNASVQEAMAGLEERLLQSLSTMEASSMDTMEGRMRDTMKEFMAMMPQTVGVSNSTNSTNTPTSTPPPPQPENSETNPAMSCKSLLNSYPHAESGYYWVSTPAGSPVRVYCEMNRTLCGGQPTGGWMRVANLDMRNASHTCPSGLTLINSTSPRKRLCDISRNGHISTNFNVSGVQYSHVCGRIIAYQNRVTAAFYYQTLNINHPYVFGVSLTHGRNPRNHIWTFAGAGDETAYRPIIKCPCINTTTSTTTTRQQQSRVPSFVGNNYFCDTALSSYYGTSPRRLQTADPLWDGQGCGPNSSCCSFNTPPWFTRDLPSPTTDDVEMRLCRPDSSGSTPIEIVELYVQ